MENKNRKAYPSDISNEMYELIMPYLPEDSKAGRPRLHSRREIIEAIFYVSPNGCTWRALPGDFPPWKTVYHYFRLWRNSGWWEE